MEQNLNQYKIFYTVAKLGNISHAAEELYISQPAISKAISKLEDGLNTTLFLRNPRGVVLTQEGKILYKYIENAFEAIYSGEENIRKINELGIGQIKIGASATLCKFLLVPYLESFIKEYPHIKISIETQSSYQNLKLLNSEKLDVALVVKPDSLSGLDFYTLGQFEDIFVATNTYLENFRLRTGYSSQKEFEKELFENANFLLLDKENVSRLYVDDYCKKNNIEIKHILEVNNMDLLIELSKIGIGVGCVMKEFVKKELSDNIITQIPLTKPFKKRTVGFAYKNNAPSSIAVKNFIDFIKEHQNPLIK